MPKLTWMNKSPPKINYLAALFRQRRLETGITAAKVAEAVGCSEENVRVHMNKPPAQWNVGMLMDYCDVLQIPYADAFEAAVKSRLPVGKTEKRQRK